MTIDGSLRAIRRRCVCCHPQRPCELPTQAPEKDPVLFAEREAISFTIAPRDRSPISRNSRAEGILHAMAFSPDPFLVFDGDVRRVRRGRSPYSRGLL
jgi:hypothetical protein